MTRRLYEKRRGNVIALFAILLPVVLLLCGVAINIAYMQLTHTEMQIAVDAAARDAAIPDAGTSTYVVPVAARTCSAPADCGPGFECRVDCAPVYCDERGECMDDVPCEAYCAPIVDPTCISWGLPCLLTVTASWALKSPRAGCAMTTVTRCFMPCRWAPALAPTCA